MGRQRTEGFFVLIRLGTGYWILDRAVVRTELDYGLVCAVRDELRADWSMSVCVDTMAYAVGPF